MARETVVLRMPWGEKVEVTGETPEEAYQDFVRQADEHDQREGTVTFWSPPHVRSQIENAFIRRTHQQLALAKN